MGVVPSVERFYRKAAPPAELLHTGYRADRRRRKASLASGRSLSMIDELKSSIPLRNGCSDLHSGAERSESTHGRQFRHDGVGAVTASTGTPDPATRRQPPHPVNPSPGVP